MKVLLSIKPEFAEKIFDGTKAFEYRKAIFQNNNVDTVVVYATMPVGKVIGEFSVGKVLEGSPTEIWRQTSDSAGISEELFTEYFDGRDKAYAIGVSSVRLFPIPLDVETVLGRRMPPQSFAYLR